MITITKDFDYYLNLPLATMKGSNMITMFDITDEMRLGLYYLMEVYHLGFHHCVRADWEWISLSQDKESEYLSGYEIRKLGMDMEVYNKLKNDFNRGIMPEGYKRQANNDKELERTEFQYTGKFGWLSPTGNFTVSDWGDHEEDAYEIIEQRGFMNEYESWEGDGILRLARDFLSIVKGYVLIHNPSMDGGYIVTNTKPMTKKQKEFLYDYFLALGNVMRASHYMED